MYDIHCHLLPFTDDGSRSFEESLMMASLAEKSGTRGIICTPHVFSERAYNPKRLDSMKNELEERLRESGIRLHIHLGQEIMVGENFKEIPAMLESKKLYTLAGSNYVLTEFHPHTEYDIIERRVEYISSCGFVPIIAHPERYIMSRKRVNLLMLKSSGALLQVNKGSLKGAFGEEARDHAHFMLRHRICDFMASDAHSVKERSPVMSNAYRAVAEMYSEEYATLIMSKNPESIIKNRKITPGEYI